jgi:Na+:H+ antiporter
VIPADVAFLLLAGIAFLGFILDALFDRLRITSVLPLMLVGVVLLATHAIPTSTVTALTGFIPYVSAIAVAFILFAVGLEVRVSELSRVFGRATLFTLAVQTSSGIALAFLAYGLVHWSLYISFVFGFGLSGPSSIAVPVLVRVARMPEGLRTTLLYESVMSDVLQLLVPLVMLGLLVSGSFSTAQVTETLLWTVLGSAAGGIVAGVAWLWLLDRLRDFAKGYTWTLTITMVLATYGISERIGLSPAISIFVFGLILGNAALLDSRAAPRTSSINWLRERLHGLRESLGLSTGGLDIQHILQVQKEVSFFASAFFFVYIGLLFDTGGLTPVLIGLALFGSIVMLVLRWAFTPLLHPYMDDDPTARRSQRGIVSFNISRGLAAAVIATIPLGLGLVIPGFLDAMFLGILLSTIVSTIGIFALYRPEAAPPTPREGTLAFPVLPAVRALMEERSAPTPAAPPPPATPSPSRPPPPPVDEPPPPPLPRGRVRP